MKKDFSWDDRMLVAKASVYAQDAHRGQYRKYTGQDYVEHPEAVAALVRLWGGTAQQVAAAWLHDVLEDTDTTRDHLLAVFGGDITVLVEELTDVFTSEDYPDMNRASRKALEAERLGNVSEEAKTIKLADIADNTKDIVAHDPDFAIVYFREKATLLEYLV